MLALSTRKTAVQKYPGLPQRGKDSARRILMATAKLSLYHNPVPGAEHVEKTGQAEDKRVALQLARESIVLLKNRDNILPLLTNSTRCERSACEMEWDFGSGLSYTSFEYSNLWLSKTSMSDAEDEH
ncbi:hypothetical protein FI667_g15888, partial [Globisporangium splendens]